MFFHFYFFTVTLFFYTYYVWRPQLRSRALHILQEDEQTKYGLIHKEEDDDDDDDDCLWGINN
jgi:hypothetical protein